ncbi:hypothetical protein C2G38_2208847 [Gigaspora rosea]|uniref:Uncharacterized protein n=1 Tax=Gigaspora rosea TaxID=44941 RepID=A0A397UGQ7_9GLOM|nr:hypothetical protein C2G38_2208847 [Gigaspora rosea]
MSKRKTSYKEKKSGTKRRALENGNFQEELSGRSNIEPTVEEFIEYKNWQITNYVSDKAFIHVFPDLEKRYEFILNLLEFNQKCLENYEHIERDRGARFQISRLEELLKDLENEIDEFYEKNQEKSSKQKNSNE